MSLMSHWLELSHGASPEYNGGWKLYMLLLEIKLMFYNHRIMEEMDIGKILAIYKMMDTSIDYQPALF